MRRIVMGHAGDPEMDRDAMLGMFRLRDTIFHKRLGWDVRSENGCERDVFDELSPVYMVARGSRRAVEGCWRLLPTTGPYMLRDTFPQLLRGEPAPCDPEIWELSRFAVAPTSIDDRRQVNFGAVTFEMMQRVVDFAESHGIGSYVTVTSVALERMLRRAGIPLRRFGDGKAQRIGKVLSVACWVFIDAQCREAVYNGAADTDAHEEAA